MTTQVAVFGLLVGWLGGWALARIFARMAMSSPMGRITQMVGGSLTVGWHFALARLVSWACFLALAVGGLWRVAQAVTR